MVPMFTCGFERSNLALPIPIHLIYWEITSPHTLKSATDTHKRAHAFTGNARLI
jgi:hypothetical protein